MGAHARQAFTLEAAVAAAGRTAIDTMRKGATIMLSCRFAVITLSAVASTGCFVARASGKSPVHTLSRATESEGAKTNRVIFVCPKDELLTIEFVISDSAKPAIVRTPDGGEFSLAAQLSGSGFRYADETHELRGRGREVTWTVGSRPPVVCTEQTPAAGGTEPN